MIDVNKTVELVNPRIGFGTGQRMTWAQVCVWCIANVAMIRRSNWIERARRAFHREDGEKLGKMIIGS